MINKNKECRKCLTLKSFSEFRNCRINKDGFSNFCKSCYKNIDSMRYKNESDERKYGRKLSGIIKRKRIFDYLKSKCCVTCGITNPIVFEFDHINGQKSYNISQGKFKLFEELMIEISKCQILCVNCHRIKTAKEKNYFVWRFINGTL